MKTQKSYRNYKWVYVVVLLIIIMFHGVNNYLWLGMNELYHGCDETSHLLNGLRFFSLLEEYKNFSDFLKMRMQFEAYYPPLLYTTSALFMYVFKTTSYRIMVMTNIIFFFLLILSTFFLGKKITGKGAGLFAAFIISMYPMVFGYSRQYNLALSLTAIVCCNILFLLMTDNFRHRVYSILFGVTFGLGMLTKPSFLLYIIGPLSFVLYRVFRAGIKPLQKRVALNFIFSMGIAFILSSWWYLGRLLHTSFRVINHVFLNLDSGAIPPPFYSVEALGFYLKAFIFWNSLFFFLIFILGFAYFVLTKAKEKGVIFLWILIPCIMMSLIVTKRVRYLMPFLSPLAIISAVGILKLKQKLLKGLIVCLVITFGIVQFFNLSYGFKPFLPLGQIKVMGLNIKIPNFQASEYYDLDRRDWKIKETVRFLKPMLQDSKKIVIFSDKKVEIAIAGDRLLYYLLLSIGGQSDQKIEHYENNSSRYLRNFIRGLSKGKYDLFIFISHSGRINWPESEGLKAFTNYFETPITIEPEERKAVTDAKRNFSLIKTVDLPKDNTLFVWQRNP